MYGLNHNKEVRASRRERCFEIASSVTNLAGSFLGEVGKVISQADRPIGEKSGFRHSPWTQQDSPALHRPIRRGIPTDIHELQDSPALYRPIENGIPADIHELQDSPALHRPIRRGIPADIHEQQDSPALHRPIRRGIPADIHELEDSPALHRPIRRGIPADIHESPSPYIKNIHGLHEGKIILVCGVPNSNANRFSIYLQQGDRPDPNLVAMVFDVRFKWGTPVSTNCVVRNHKEGAWDSRQEEISAPCFPFQRRKDFQIIIMVDRDGFKVAVDDQHFVEFNHRIDPFSCIDTLWIDGDVMISTVQIQE